MPYNLDIPGFMIEAELQHIETLAKNVPENGKVIEIGSFCGRSAWAWSKSIPKSATLTCIDTWHGEKKEPFVFNETTTITSFDLEIFKSYTQDCHNIIPIKGDSNKVLLTLEKESYDLIFVDGNHKNPYIKNDLYFSYPLLKKGGILCGHDFWPVMPDVVVETRRFSAVYNLPISFAPDSSIWVIKTNGRRSSK